MARPHIEPLVDKNVSLKKLNLPGFGAGMQYRMMSFDTDTGACTMVVQYGGGYKQPPGFSYSEVEMLILQGRLKYGKITYGPGQYFLIPPGVSMPAMSTNSGCQVLLMYNSSEPNFVESDADHEGANRTGLSTINSYDGLPWAGNSLSPATATGCLLKILKYDPRSHALSFLYCMTPMFQQDNISYHDCAEEAYHIWGTSWMMQFGDLPTGGYFWRPAYINHGGFASKKGILAFGRTDYQLFNHFHFNPWTEPDENQERAAARLHDRNPELYNWVLARDHNHPHPHDFDYGPLAAASDGAKAKKQRKKKAASKR